MRYWIFLALSVVLIFLLRSPANTVELHAAYSVSPIQEPMPVTLSETKVQQLPLGKVQIPNGKPVRIHWNLKLPDRSDILPIGNFVFRDAATFERFLGQDVKSYLRWNNIDFSKQMTIVISEGDSTGKLLRIDSIVEGVNEVVVFVAEDEIRRVGGWPAMLIRYAFGAVINKSPKNVRFSFFRTQ